MAIRLQLNKLHRLQYSFYKTLIMKKILFFITTWATSLSLKSQTCSIDQFNYFPSDPITVSYSGGSNSLDWVGLYHINDVPGTINSIVWDYTPPPSGQLVFTTTLDTGWYKANYFCCDGYTILAADTFYISPIPASIYSRLKYFKSTDSLIFKIYSSNTGDSVKIFSNSDLDINGLPLSAATPFLEQKILQTIYFQQIIFSPSSSGFYKAFLIASGNILGTDTFQIITAPVLDTTVTLTRIAYGSCALQDNPQPTLLNAIARNPQLWIGLGDNFYLGSSFGGPYDTIGIKLHYEDWITKRTEFQKLRVSMPMTAIWDDHDYGGYDDEDKDFLWKKQSKKLFMDFFEEPLNSPRRNRDGIYTSYYFGNTGQKVQIILTDGRYFLDDRKPIAPYCGTNDYCAWDSITDFDKTILGKEQWLWLEKELQRPADFRIIAHGGSFGLEYNGFEGWSLFPFQRERLLAILKKYQINHVMFITGDLHWTEISKYTNQACYPVFDHVASAINRSWSPIPSNSFRVTTATNAHNFGIMELDWAQKNVTLKAVDASNNELYSYNFSMDSTKFLTNSTPVISSSKSQYSIGEDLNFTFSNSMGNEYDQLAIYPLSVWNGRDIYGNFSSTPSYVQFITGQTSGTINVINSLPSGNYVAGLFCCGSSFDLDTANFSVGNVGFAENNLSEKIFLYPNPNYGKFILKFQKNISGMIEIYDLLGEKIYSDNCKSISEKEISLPDLSEGIYVVKLKTENEIFIEKISVMK